MKRMLWLRTAVICGLALSDVASSKDVEFGTDLSAVVSAMATHGLKPLDKDALEGEALELARTAAKQDAAIFEACRLRHAKPEKFRGPLSQLGECLGDADPDAVELEAITTLFKRHDSDGAFIGAKELERLTAAIDRPWGSVGIAAKATPNGIVLVRVFRSSPLRAHAEPGDEIVSVDQRPLAGKAIEEAMDMIAGDPGTTIELGVAKPGLAPKTVVLTRAVIEREPLELRLEGDVAIVALPDLPQSASSDLGLVLKQAKENDASALVLDLRGNPGGLLDQAIACADLFLRKVPIASNVGRRPRDVERYFADGEEAASGLPVVVLIDRMTASGAEIIAAALQDNRRAVIVGEPSFRRGSVQTLLYASRKTAFRLTTSQLVRANGERLADGGVRPDVLIEGPGTAGAPPEQDTWLTQAVVVARTEVAKLPALGK